MERQETGRNYLRYLRPALLVLAVAAVAYVCTGRPFYRLDGLEGEDIAQARACFSVGEPVELTAQERQQLAETFGQVRVYLLKFWSDGGGYLGVPTITGTPMFRLELADGTGVEVSVVISSDATLTVDGLSYQCDRQSAERLWQLYYEQLAPRREPYELPDPYTIYEY